MSTIYDLAEDLATARTRALDALTSGSVVVMPVGGVYAIIADAFRTAATQRIFAARRRSRVTPLPVLLRSERQVGGMAVEVPKYAERLMEAYWPGDLTLIAHAAPDLTWDLGNGKGTVQLRLPEGELIRELVAEVGPLACTAANRLDQPRPLTVADAKSMLGVLVPVYLDGGEVDGHVSTIVDATGPSPVVHREGAIPADHVHLVASGELAWGERPPPDAVVESVVAEDEPVADVASEDGGDQDPQSPPTSSP